jgi:uncharacterized membrane protein YqjE
VISGHGLAETLSSFEKDVSSARRRHASAEGVLLISGAADQTALSLVDPIPGVRAVLLDDADSRATIERTLAEILISDPGDLQRQDFSTSDEMGAREKLAEIRRQTSRAEADARQRLQAEDFGGGERGSSISKNTVIELNQQNFDPSLERRQKIVESILSSTMSPPLTFLQNSITTGGGLTLIASVGMIVAAFVAPQLMQLMLFEDSPVLKSKTFHSAPAVLFVYGAVGLLWWGYTSTRAHLRETRERIRFQRWSYQILEEMYVLGFPESDLIRVRNMLVDAPDAAGGFRFAIDFAKKRLPPGLRDDKPILSLGTPPSEGNHNAA